MNFFFHAIGSSSLKEKPPLINDAVTASKFVKSMPGIWYQDPTQTSGGLSRSHSSVNKTLLAGQGFKLYLKIVDVTTGTLLGPDQDDEMCIREPIIMKGCI